MKSKLLKAVRLLSLFIVTALTLLFGSCDGSETTDSTGFILHYYGVTDIGPSMSFTLPAPTYKGNAPYDFTITNVTLNNEAYANAENFVIDTETGAITIQNTEAMSAGLYTISVGCYSNGGFHNFKDAVQINMLLAVPEGVTVEPAEVLVNQDEENWTEASAQVTTEKDKHVSITGYAIAQDETKPYLSYFTFDSKNEGKIIIRESEKDKLIAGESYTLSLKLTTKAGEHMYADAVTFKIVSKPRNLFYMETEALPDLFETSSENKSAIPTIAGSKENLKFTIKSVAPESTAFIIDEATGQISVPAGNTLEISETPYVFNITASNTYGSKDFEAVYSVKIVAFIDPIKPETFNYTAIDKLYQLGGSFENKLPDAGFVGGAPTFLFDESNSDEIKAQIAKNIISINTVNGAISIANNHTLTAKTHEIKVKVSNKKNEEGVVKSLSVTVLENPNNFTYVSWGTNIEGDMPMNVKLTDYNTPRAEININYRNQFRFINRGNFYTDPIIVQSHDIPASSTVRYTIVNKFPEGGNKFPNVNLEDDGSFNLSGNNPLGSNYEGGILLVKVTASGNNAPAVSRNIPIFFNTPKKQAGTVNSNEVLLFTPFVVRINPRTGACSSTECKVIEWNSNTYIKDLSVANKFVVDYRSSFTYCNFDNNQNHKSGKLTANSSTESEMLYQVWSNCGYTKPSDMGTRVPLCYYNTNNVPNPGAGDLSIKAGYIDAATKQVVINPNKWIGADGLYPCGAVLGETKYDLNGDANQIHNGSSTLSYYSLILWFDETYEGN